ncbi:MAG: DUF2157 domain-containing protein [bacterium]|nr:DUF2157 domain-containing protein [bacterium]
MDNQTLLQELARKIASGEVRREDAASALGLSFEAANTVNSSVEVKTGHEFSLIKILYVLGAAIVLLGIVFLVYQIWYDIGAFGRIAVTFGAGLVFMVAGSILLLKKEGGIGQVFHMIGGLVLPGGALVLLDEMFGSVELWPATAAFLVMSLIYILLSYTHKQQILTFFTVAHSTIFAYLLVLAIVEDSSNYRIVEDILAYLTMAMGASYVLLGKSWKDTWNSGLSGVLYLFGSGGFLAAAFSRIFDAAAWEILYPFLLIGSLILSTKIKSKGILSSTMIFLVAYIIYITSEYFADSIGWPLSLVILGFIIIGLGYTSVAINKKFISER